MRKVNQKIILKISLFVLVFILIGGFILAFALSLYLNNYINTFVKAANLEKQQFLDDVYFGMRNPYQKKYLTILILGLDQRNNDNSLLTDTILLTTVNTQTGDYLLFSLPRDLWLDDYKTKINALYYYGKKQNSEDDSQLVKTTIEDFLETKIDYVAVLQMEQIKDLIDLIGGVEIEVERSFIDEEFPKDDGSNQLITIEFQQGRQIFDGEKALQFMRSRKSKDEIESTDEARQKRQKKVILAIKEKLLKDKSILKSPEKMGHLYQFLLEGIETNPALNTKIIASFWKIGKSIFTGGSQKEIEIPWRGEEAILVPDRDPIYKTWILRPKNNNWDLLKDYYQQNLP